MGKPTTAGAPAAGGPDAARPCSPLPASATCSRVLARVRHLLGHVRPAPPCPRLPPAPPHPRSPHAATAAACRELRGRRRIAAAYRWSSSAAATEEDSSAWRWKNWVACRRWGGKTRLPRLRKILESERGIYIEIIYTCGGLSQPIHLYWRLAKTTASTKAIALAVG